MDIECQPNSVWSSLKHLGTHDSSEFVPFAVSLLCLLMVGTIMSLHVVFVKSTSPLQKNGYENCIYNMNNIHKGNEDNMHDTNYINKNDTNNHDARKLHE